MGRPALCLLVTIWSLAAGACDPNKISGPAPAVSTPIQLQLSAVPGSGSLCQPRVSVSMSGPVGAQLTWTGMAFHILEGPYNQDFDQAFTQRFWAGQGLAVGESTSSNSAGFGTGFVHITYVFRYTVTTNPAATYTDSVSTLCQ